MYRTVRTVVWEVGEIFKFPLLLDFITRDMEEQDDTDDDELDLDDLEDMDPDERREALEDAGYDPDDFDFDDDGDSDDFWGNAMIKMLFVPPV